MAKRATTLMLLGLMTACTAGVSDIPIIVPPPPAGVDVTAFCASPGADVLTSLDGTWTLRQSAGSSRAVWDDRVIILPVPAQPPTELILDYDADARVLDMRGADLEDEMHMFPLEGEQDALAGRLIGLDEPQNLDSLGDACSWEQLPTLMGLRKYYGGRFEVDYDIYLYRKGACHHTELWTSEARENMRTRWERCVELTRSIEEQLASLNAELELEVTLFVRFPHPDYGVGMVYFDGDQEVDVPDRPTVKYSARAPVQLVRSR